MRYRVTPEHIEAVLARRANSPGAARLRRVLRGDFRVTLSKLEDRFLELLAAAGLPFPRRIGEWRSTTSTVAGANHRSQSSSTAIAITAPATHGRPTAGASARRGGRGDEFRRYTWHDVYEEPKPMLAELGALLLVRRRVSSPSRREALQ